MWEPDDLFSTSCCVLCCFLFATLNNISQITLRMRLWSLKGIIDDNIVNHKDYCDRAV